MKNCRAEFVTTLLTAVFLILLYVCSIGGIFINLYPPAL